MGESGVGVGEFDGMSADEEVLVRAHRVSKELVRALQVEPFSEGTRALALGYVPWRDEAAAVWEALQKLPPEVLRGRLDELMRVNRRPVEPLSLADCQVAWVGPERWGKARRRSEAGTGGAGESSGSVRKRGQGQGGSGS